MYLKATSAVSADCSKMPTVKNDFLAMLFLLIVFGVTLLLLHDHCQRGYSGTTRAFNARVFIERALKRLPICSVDDRSRQRALLYTLQTWTQLAEHFDIPFWISHKSLRSYVRSGNLAAHHSDIDVSILVDDLPKLVRLNLLADYQLEVLRFVDRRANVSVNIWPTNLSHLNFRRLIETIRTIQRIFPLEPCVFAGIRVWCPSQPEKLLQTIYRSTEKEVFCSDGKWIS